MGHPIREAESNPDSLTPIREEVWLAREADPREQPGYKALGSRELAIPPSNQDSAVRRTDILSGEKPKRDRTQKHLPLNRED